MKTQYKKGGFTLVEMLVVVAIVSVIAAVSIPVAAKYSSLGRSDIERTADSIQEILRAAKIYATTNNVSTAVAYNLGAYETSYGDGYRRVITGAAVVRALSREEIRKITVSEGLYGDTSNYFTPVRDADGAFRRFNGDTCMAFWREEASVVIDGEDVIPRTLIDMSQPNKVDEAVRDMGLSSIYILDTYVDDATNDFVGEYVLAPADSVGIPLGFPSGQNAFPAHVFKSSGSLKSESPKQRFTLYISQLPSADVEEIFVRQATVGSGIPRAESLELFATLGRIKFN